MSASAGRMKRAFPALGGIAAATAAAAAKAHAYLVARKCAAVLARSFGMRGWNSTPSVRSTKGLFAAASGWIAEQSASGRGAPLDATTLATIIAANGGKVSVFAMTRDANCALDSSRFLLASAAFLAALLASAAFEEAASLASIPSASTNAPSSNRPLFTPPERMKRKPNPSNAPRRNSPAYEPPFAKRYTPNPSFWLLFHWPSYVAPLGYSYTPKPCLLSPVTDHSPWYTPPSSCRAAAPRASRFASRCSEANTAAAAPKTTSAFGTSYSAARRRPSAPHTASTNGNANVPRLAPHMAPRRSPRSYLGARRYTSAPPHATAAVANAAVSQTRGTPGPNSAPVCVNVCRSIAGSVTLTTNRSITSPSARSSAPNRRIAYPTAT